MRRLGAMLALWAVMAWLASPLLAAEYREGDSKPPNADSPTLMIWDGTDWQVVRGSSSGILRVMEEFAPSSSAPVQFPMANGSDQAVTATITEIGDQWTAAGDYYNKGLVVGVNMTASDAGGVDLFLLTSHSGIAGTFGLVIYKTHNAGVSVEDTVSWKFTADVLDTNLTGKGILCAIPVEAQNAVNSAQHWKVGVRVHTGAGHSTFWVRGQGKR